MLRSVTGGRCAKPSSVQPYKANGSRGVFPIGDFPILGLVHLLGSRLRVNCKATGLYQRVRMTMTITSSLIGSHLIWRHCSQLLPGSQVYTAGEKIVDCSLYKSSNVPGTESDSAPAIHSLNLHHRYHGHNYNSPAAKSHSHIDGYRHGHLHYSRARGVRLRAIQYKYLQFVLSFLPKLHWQPFFCHGIWLEYHCSLN